MADRKKLGLNLIPKGIVSQGQYSKSLTRKHPPLNYNFPRNAELDSLCLEMDFLLNKIDTKIKPVSHSIQLNLRHLFMVLKSTINKYCKEEKNENISTSNKKELSEIIKEIKEYFKEIEAGKTIGGRSKSKSKTRKLMRS